jgi:hypothetical protein
MAQSPGTDRRPESLPSPSHAEESETDHTNEDRGGLY